MEFSFSFEGLNFILFFVFRVSPSCSSCLSISRSSTSPSRNAIAPLARRARSSHCLEIRDGRSPPIYALTLLLHLHLLPPLRSDHFCSFREPFWPSRSSSFSSAYLYAHASSFPCTQFVPFELERGESSTSISPRVVPSPTLCASCCCDRYQRGLIRHRAGGWCTSRFVAASVFNTRREYLNETL